MNVVKLTALYTPKLSKMMNTYQLQILEYVNQQHQPVDLTELDQHFRHLIPKHTFGPSIDYLIKARLVVMSPLDSTLVTISEIGKEALRQKATADFQATMREHLEMENLKLQNDAMMYQLKMRDLEEKLQYTKLRNFKLQDRIFYCSILFFLLGALFSYIASNWQWLLSKLR